LRFLKEEEVRDPGRGVTLEEIAQESNLSKEDVAPVLAELEREGLLESGEKGFQLTSRGSGEAQGIYQKHKEVEHLWGHKVAHTLEHYEGALEILPGIGPKRKKRIEEFREGDNSLPDGGKSHNHLPADRAGSSPWHPFSVRKRREDLWILEINGRLVAIDKRLASGMEGMPR